MLKRFFPKQPNFFAELLKIAELGQKSMKELSSLSQHPKKSESIAKEISDLEHKPAASFRASLQLLSDTFITPIEREHLHALFETIDDVVDRINDSAQLYHTYRLEQLSPGTQEVMKLVSSGVDHLFALVDHIDDLKAPVELHRLARELNKTGSRVKTQVNQTLADLYDSNLSAGAILKEKDFILSVQSIIFSAEEVTSIMETVLLAIT